jgi:hypothetical protein
MAKTGKEAKSDWIIGTHCVHAYKERVPDPAVKHKRRTGKEMRRMIAQALNRVKQDARTVYLVSDSGTHPDKFGSAAPDQTIKEATK